MPPETDTKTAAITTRAARITAMLQHQLQPTLLELRDESHLHAGHNAEAASGGETHFRLTIASPLLTPLSRVDQHRRINALLAAEFDSGLHALAISVKNP